MNRKQAKEFFPIMQAFAEGRVIECRTRTWELNKGWQYSSTWKETQELKFQDTYEYRIKPEQKYRPFEHEEECWAEMQKHQPIGWVKDKNGDKSIIGTVHSDNAVFVCNYGRRAFEEVFKYYTFADGTPFGVKEEE